MKITSFAVFLIVALFYFLPVAEAKDNIFTINRDFRVKSVAVELKSINDVGLIYVSHEDGA